MSNSIPNPNTQAPKPWRYSTRGIALRIFLTCWIVYSLHFATNTVREIYPALALGDHLSFRVDEYAGMHPDIFETPEYGWHIGNNPGASMLAAIPYALSRPIIDPIVDYVKNTRMASGQTEPPTYDSPWPMAREFYQEAWIRGYDIKFGLAAFVMQSFCMAPVSALSAMVMFYLLRWLLRSEKVALGLSLLYAFGTPVFFRTGYLNQNLMLGIFAFIGFLIMWDPSNSLRLSQKTKYFLGGIAGGIALLFDYSGAVFLIGLFLYGFIKQLKESTLKDAFRISLWYVLGTIAPVGLLWFYQWKSFGNPFLPGQNWMPPVEWSDLGYQGYGFPQLSLLLMLAFDYRFGLFTSSPLMLLAIAAPFIDRGKDRRLPRFEMYFILALFCAFWLFFSGSNYTRLQFNTGIRYMTAILPFLFVPVAVVLMRMPKVVISLIAVVSVTESWCLAMYRDVESGYGLLNPILHVFTGGLQLPALTTISRIQGQFGDLFSHGASATPLFLLAAAIIYIVWSPVIRKGI
jgi:hypothetical protein